MTEKLSKPHSLKTRLMHMAVALLVISQAVSSQFMTPPDSSSGENLMFEIHEYSGIAIFILIFGFWVHAMRRQGGTPMNRLFPWFSSPSHAALIADAKIYLTALKHFRLPDHKDHAPLPSAFHGLGILAVMLMTATGLIMFVSLKAGAGDSALFSQFANLHHFLAKFVWVYLIVHAAAAFLNQFAGKQSLTDMWSVKRD